MADPVVINETPTKARERAFVALFALFATLTLCSVVVLSTPRALVPQDLPPLVLDRSQVARAIAADVALAAKAPGGIDVDELAARYLDEGRAELSGPTEQRLVELRQQEWRQLVQRVFARIGPAGVRAMRAQTLVQFMQVWHGETVDEADKQGLFGSLPEMLRTYGFTADDGTLLAPELCLRSNFKARWNLIHGLPVTDGFSPIERQAFEGWIALHASKAPAERRLQAAQAFYDAGGHRGAQALATWLYRIDRLPEARTLMQREQVARGELFTRNYVLGLSAAAR